MLFLLAVFAVVSGAALSRLSYAALVAAGAVSLMLWAALLAFGGWSAGAVIGFCALGLALQQAAYLATLKCDWTGADRKSVPTSTGPRPDRPC
ncbi:exported hypothetical protein [Bradyrhizobium sp. ORS 375]|nr:exported hypothetical protein [Bradyrhizobium sp. ORS 375]